MEMEETNIFIELYFFVESVGCWVANDILFQLIIFAANSTFKIYYE